MMRSILIMIAFLMLLACGQSGSEVEDRGAQSAGQWLAIVDRGEYEKSWVESAAFFQSKVSKSGWVTMLGDARGAFGAVLNRSLVKAEFTSTLPGAADGEYVVATFRTSFEQKKSAIETVTLSLSDDGEWKVSGYFIK